MKTYSAKNGEISQSWFIVDASEHTLGRLATRIATVLRGKHKAEFTPHVDTGDYVVVVNAEKIKLTGRKEKQKMYHNYSGYKGGLRSSSAAEIREVNPERMVEDAVKGMLPKNRLSRQVLKKLKVYAGEEHPHSAQGPQPLTF
jgi:large subunit ribosomal protein L13